MAIDYLGGIGVLPDPMGAINKQLAFKVGLDAQQADAMFKAAQISAAANKLQRQAQFTTAMQGYLAHPTAEGLAGLIGSFPEYSEDAKAAFGALDGAKQKRDLTQLGEVASLASSGNWSKAAEAMQARVEADRAAGDNDPTDQYILQGLQSGDEAKQKEALGLLSYGLGVAAGPEHAASFLETYGLSKKPDVGELDGIVYDKKTGQPLYQSPYPRIVPGQNGSFYVQPRVGNIPTLGSGGTGPAPAQAPAGATDATGAVSSTLSSVLPAPVVAGFLGNFHVEGGYGGAQGDGGTASGIAQWRESRIANFQRVMGKPIEQATPQEQAQFVLYEMQHPEEAGMTVAQRDKILNAKTADQAAALIDKYYERSSGEHRKKRMAAANSFANGGGYYGGATHTATVGGKTYYQINGQWYDNPEGQ